MALCSLISHFLTAFCFFLSKGFFMCNKCNDFSIEQYKNPKLDMTGSHKFAVENKVDLTSFWRTQSKIENEERFCSCCGIKLYKSNKLHGEDDDKLLLSSDESGETLAFPKNKEEYLCEACYILEHYKYISPSIFIPHKNGHIEYNSSLESIIYGRRLGRVQQKINSNKISLWNSHNFTCTYCGVKADEVSIITDRKINKEEVISIAGFDFNFQTCEEFLSSSFGSYFKKPQNVPAIIAKIGDSGSHFKKPQNVPAIFAKIGDSGFLTIDHIIPNSMTKELPDNYKYLKRSYACACHRCNLIKKDYHISNFAV